MARFYPSGGAGGADVSVVTATAENVEKGKVIVGPDGKPLTGELELVGTAGDSQVLAGQTYYNTDLHQIRTGTMVNRGAWNHSGLLAGASVTIPGGYHNEAGKVTAASLASQTPGDAAAGHIWTGKKAYVNGQQVTGTLATQGGSTTTPGTAAKTIVTPNKIVTGNIIVAGDANLVPANIKKGVPIFGNVGLWEGYVANALDLYYRGSNPGGMAFYSGIAPEYVNSLDTDRITIHYNTENATGAGSYAAVASASSYNLTGYTGVAVRISVNKDLSSSNTSFGLTAGNESMTLSAYGNPPANQKVFGRINIGASNSSDYVANLKANTEYEFLIPFDYGAHSLTSRVGIKLSGFTKAYTKFMIHQIRLY